MKQKLVENSINIDHELINKIFTDAKLCGAMYACYFDIILSSNKKKIYLKTKTKDIINDKNIVLGQLLKFLGRNNIAVKVVNGKKSGLFLKV